ncbi:uncharacterized protein DUF4238 [Prosthecobacter fusiformis]|uniref:Uncharacterized protein DUF4238 n=1 Tax=Prosthecobacter fusiformis TaxID=48464 RepID=A0A4R7RTK3_9BACT|nr:DUF4238 domain-containing protein [Prosthecobacter fusiformis]TDU68115.1 uncharacterized protein DUF4238 [Prosthecobacter fusiformis]
MGDPKHHHFIPQFYLRRFADSREGLHQIEKIDRSRAIPTRVSKSGSKRDYHTLDWKDEAADRCTIESRLSVLESRQDKMLKALTEDSGSLESLRHELIDFVTLMFHRVPAFKRDIEKRLRDVVNSTGRMLLRAGKFPEPPESIKDLIREKGDDIFDAQISNWKLVEEMFNLASQSPISKILEAMNCSILSVEDESSFLITSDTPVVLYNANHDPKSPYGSGFAQKAVEVTIPLSSKMLLLFSHSDSPHGRLTHDLIRHFNQRMIVGAERFIYTQEVSEELLDDLQRLHRQQAGFVSSTLEHSDGALFISKTVPVTRSHLQATSEQALPKQPPTATVP